MDVLPTTAYPISHVSILMALLWLDLLRDIRARVRDDGLRDLVVL